MELGVALVWLLIGILIGLSIALWINLIWVFPTVYNFVKQNKVNQNKVNQNKYWQRYLKGIQ